MIKVDYLKGQYLRRLKIDDFSNPPNFEGMIGDDITVLCLSASDNELILIQTMVSNIPKIQFERGLTQVWNGDNAFYIFWNVVMNLNRWADADEADKPTDYLKAFTKCSWNPL